MRVRQFIRSSWYRLRSYWCLIDHRSDHQYLSDGDIHTGTDPYVCAEDSAVFVGMMIFGSWILTQLTEYITDLWSNFGVFLS